jgi:RNA polymerase sigma-70 factor (ECF subfamily)
LAADATNGWLSQTSTTALSAAIALPQPLEAGYDSTAVETDVTQLFEELQAPIFRYLLSIGLTSADADETSQETFLALFRHLLRGRPRTNLRGWIFRVAHNQGLKRRRDSRRRRGAIDGHSSADNTPCSSLDPEQHLQLKQRSRQVLAVVAALAPRDRYCLSLRAEGLGYREIARGLGISLGAVSLSIQRSLTRLRRADEGGERCV